MPILRTTYVTTTKSEKKFERLQKRLSKVVKEIENFRFEFKEVSRETIED